MGVPTPLSRRQAAPRTLPWKSTRGTRVTPRPSRYRRTSASFLSSSEFLVAIFSTARVPLPRCTEYTACRVDMPSLPKTVTRSQPFPIKRRASPRGRSHRPSSSSKHNHCQPSKSRHSRCGARQLTVSDDLSHFLRFLHRFMELSRHLVYIDSWFTRVQHGKSCREAGETNVSSGGLTQARTQASKLHLPPESRKRGAESRASQQRGEGPAKQGGRQDPLVHEQTAAKALPVLAQSSTLTGYIHT